MGYPSEVLDTDVSCFVRIEQCKYFIDIFSGVLGEQSGSEEMNELFEGDMSGAFRCIVEDDLIDRLVAYFRSK